MLAGIKFVDKELAARSIEADRKASKKEKKLLKKEKRKQKKAAKREAQSASESDSEVDIAAGDEAHNENGAAQTLKGTGGQEQPVPAAAQRDEWMHEANARPLFTADAPGKDEGTNEEKQAARAERMKARELNPEIRGDQAAPGKHPGRQAAPVVGDGGASWRMKALRRAQAQAAEEGSNLGELVSERWGSLQHLTATLTEGRAAPARAHLHAAHDRRSSQPGNPEGGKRSAYLDDVGSDKLRMKRPDDSSLSWRAMNGGKDTSRQDTGRPATFCDRPARSTRDPLGSKADAEALRSAASALNKFAGDGSFMDNALTRSAAARSPQREPLHAGQRSTGSSPSSPDRPTPSRSRLREGVAPDHLDLQGGSSAQRFSKPLPDGAMRASQRDGHGGPDSVRNPLREALRAGQMDARSPANSPDSPSELDPGRAKALFGPQTSSRPMPSAAETPAADSMGGPNASAGPRLEGPTSRNSDAAPSGQATAGPDASAGGNKGVAAALRARLLGKAASASSSPSQQPSQRPAMKNTIVLPQVDAAGRAMPGEFGRATKASTAGDRGGRPRKLQRYGEEGQKERYFADDDKKDLDQLVREQRYGDPGDMDAAFAANVASKACYRQKATDVDDEYDVDGGLDMYEAKRKRGNKEQLAQREKAARVSDYQRMTSAQDQCNLCFASPRRPRHLTISIGQGAYLLLPPRYASVK
ncbi:hypothetical protein WJX84_001060, partial [Apatococcus fuscideae]